MRDFESSFHFGGMLGGLKGRKRRVKSIIYFLFSELVPLFFNFLYHLLVNIKGKTDVSQYKTWKAGVINI